MSTQPLFKELDRPPKQVSDTSCEVYKDIRQNIGDRELNVLKGLQSYLETVRRCPTSYELFEYMEAKGMATDLNSVRPRLTEMSKDSSPFVESRVKRLCTSKRGQKNRRVSTWNLTERGKAFLAGK